MPVIGGSSSTFLPTTEKGAANGVASLDAGGLVPVAQLPATSAGVLGYINVKDVAYGAKGDARAVYDATATSGSPTVTSPTASFTAGDVGKKAVVGHVSGGQLFTSTVLTVNSATSVTLAGNVPFATVGTGSLCIGTDDTTAIQAAMTAAATAGGATVFFPRGMYLVAGPQVTGSVTGTGASTGTTFTYSGQLLFPAVNNSAAMLPIRLLGETPAAGASVQSIIAGAPPSGGSILVSNATTGSVFDAIPQSASFANMATTRSTNVHAQFEALGIRAPYGFPITAMNAACTMGLTTRQVRVDVLSAALLIPNDTHASSRGIDTPAKGNFGVVHLTDTEVIGYGAGMVLYEHTMLDGGYVQATRTALLMGKSDHLNTVHNTTLQHCNTYIGSVNNADPSYLAGSLTIEPNCTLFIDDPAGNIRGELALNCGGDSTAVGGLPTNGGYGMNVKLIARSNTAYPATTMQGWMGQPVAETFVRRVASSTALHATSITQHPWETGDGGAAVIGTVSSVAVPVSGWGTRYVAAPPSQSVSVRSRVTLSAGQSSIGIIPRAKQDQNSATWFAVWLQLNGATNVIGMSTRFAGGAVTTVASLTSAGLVAGTTYELSVHWDQPVKNGPATVTAYLDGVLKLTHTLSGTDQARYGFPSRVGLSLNPVGVEDYGSRWLDFYAMPA